MIRKLQEKGIRFPLVAVVGLVLFAMLVFVLPVYGAGEVYPTVLVDQGCTDSFDTPAAATEFVLPPSVQTSGSGDGNCDHDSRILTGALVADTTFGPLRGGKTACVLVFADGNTVTGGDTKWGIVVQIKQPHNDEMQSIDSSVLLTGVTDGEWMIGLPTGYSYGSLDESLNARLPGAWFLVLDLNTATSWTGEISLVGC